MSQYNHNANDTKHAIEHNIEFFPESLGTSDESLLGIYCQDCFTPQTPALTRTAERFYLQSLARQLIPNERISQCLRVIAPGHDTVELHRNPETLSAHYKNLLTCARVWFCTVCASKITERRAKELQDFCVHWNKERGSMALITYTIQHQKGDTLLSLLDILKDARRKMKQGKAWQKIKDNVFWYGTVSTTEVTHGSNGWHPHIHELVFFEFDVMLSKIALEEKLSQRWQSSVQRAGGDASLYAGLDYTTADTAIYSYISKHGHQPSNGNWSIDREVSKAVSKRAKKGSRTPWQLLDDYGQGDDHAGYLFQEYAHAMKGRNQLVWSPNLKSEYKELDQQSDEEIAEEITPDYELFASLTAGQWKAIRDMDKDIRGDLLAIAGAGNREQFFDMLLAYGIPLDVEF